MNIRTVRKKIKSVGNVKKITKAMQLVSAIKMKKSQQQAQEGQPYRTHLEKIIEKMIATLDPGFSRLMEKNILTKPKDLVIFVSSNKGLCGSFNFNLFRYLIKKVDFDKSDFITIGKKGALFVGKMGRTILADFSSGPFIDSVSAVFQTALTAYLQNKYTQVILIYNKFISTLQFEPTATTLLPVSRQLIEAMPVEPKGEYIIEPSAATIVDSLLRSVTEEKIRGAIADSEAAEHSARMVAMKNATDNAEDVIYNLILLRNKLRQEKITYELLDMVTAKESVESI